MGMTGCVAGFDIHIENKRNHAWSKQVFYAAGKHAV
jgi:hypothetical protein